MRKTTQKQQRRSSTESLIKTGKRRDVELAEDVLNQVTGGETIIPAEATKYANDPMVSAKYSGVGPGFTKSKC